MIILGLGLGEVATIGVGTSVLICEGLGGDLLVDYDRGGGVCRGSVDHRGVVGNGGMVGDGPWATAGPRNWGAARAQPRVVREMRTWKCEE